MKEVHRTPEEEEAYRKREARKDRLHKAYLRRVANGSQAVYDARRKAKRKAEVDAQKAARHAEDIENGVYIPLKDLPDQRPMRAGEDRPTA